MGYTKVMQKWKLIDYEVINTAHVTCVGRVHLHLYKVVDKPSRHQRQLPKLTSKYSSSHCCEHFYIFKLATKL